MTRCQGGERLGQGTASACSALQGHNDQVCSSRQSAQPQGQHSCGMSALPVYSKQPKSGICSSIQDTLSRAEPTHTTAQAAGPSQPRGLQNGTKESFQSEKCLPLPTVSLIRSREAQLEIQATHKRELKVSNQQKQLSYSTSTSLTPSPPSYSMKGRTHERTLNSQGWWDTSASPSAVTCVYQEWAVSVSKCLPNNPKNRDHF